MLTLKRSRTIGLDGLLDYPPPEETKTYRPLSHYDAVTTLLDAIASKGWEIKESCYGVSKKDGNRIFGVLNLEGKLSKDYRFSIGLRNSYDRSTSYGICAGLNVCVCDNLLFSGQIVSKHKHNHNLMPSEVVSDAIEQLPAKYEFMGNRFLELKKEEIDDEDAAHSLIKLAESGAINSSDILPIFSEFKYPTYKEFESPTKYNLAMAITERFKNYTSAMRIEAGFRKLSQFLELEPAN